jgi:hypothetical protein
MPSKRQRISLVVLERMAMRPIVVPGAGGLRHGIGWPGLKRHRWSIHTVCGRVPGPDSGPEAGLAGCV